jgi:replicative DNA helicase
VSDPLAETAVLSAMMADDTNRSAAQAMEHLTVEDFTSDTNKTLFEACRTLTAPYNEIDVAMESGLTAECMEVAKLHGGGQIERYIDLLIASRQTTLVRAALLKATDSLAEGDPQEVASAFIASCSTALASRRHAVSCGIAVKSALADFLATNEGGPDALSTGFNSLDELLGGGFRRGTVNIIAARPGVGKSALALWFTLQVAKHGKNTAFVSLEMSATECGGRILCAQSGQRRAYKKGLYSPQHISHLHDTASAMSTWPIRFKDDAEDSLDSIVAFVQRESIERGVDLVVVDYLQLVNAPGESTYQRVSHASRAFKKLSMQQDVPVIVLSQLSRALETQGRAPALSDLKDSGSIEQDADIVMLLSRAGESDTADTDTLCVHLAKNRNGPGGKVNLTFEKAFGRFKLPERLN